MAILGGGWGLRPANCLQAFGGRPDMGVGGAFHEVHQMGPGGGAWPNGLGLAVPRVGADGLAVWHAA